MDTIKFTVFGNPKPQARHRMGKGYSYDPSAKVKETFATNVQKHRPETPWKGALRIDLMFFFPRPRSHYRTGKRCEELKPDPPKYYTCKGRNDWDNLGKLVCDALNGIMFEDDGQIAVATVVKRYSTKPRTEVKITRLI